jgi:hypothetical protein
VTGARLLPRLAHLRVSACLVVAIGVLAIVPAARAATTRTVCSAFCMFTSIQPAVDASSPGDTVDVKASGSPYTEQVTVTEQITLEGTGSPVLKLEPSSSNMPTLHFTSAGTGSTLKGIQVKSDGSTANDAIDFEQADGTITDVSATATGRALFVNASGVTVGPKVSVTSTGSGEFALVDDHPATVMGVTATATAASGTGGNFHGGAAVTDSTFTGGGIALNVAGGTTARRVVATGGVGILGGDAIVTDSLAIGSGFAGVRGDSLNNALQLRNVTAIATSANGSALEAREGEAGNPGTLIVAKNVIAHGALTGTDVTADTQCVGTPCSPGTVEIGYSNFHTTSAGGVDTSTIGHNQSHDDPQFVNGTVGPSQDFHLKGTSPAIGAGSTDGQTTLSDLERKPRPAAGQSEPSIGAYEPAVHALTVSVSGSGSVSAPGLNCPGSCSNSYPDGSTVTLTATPAAGFELAGWSGACSGTGGCQVTIAGDQTVTATFTAIPPPGNTALPMIGGTPVEDATLVASDGTWTGSPSAFAYQWQDCDAFGNACVNVADATSNVRRLTADEVGHALRVVVTATNGVGSTSATSPATATATATAVSPVLSDVRLGSSAFAAKKGTTLSLTLSEAATVDVVVTQTRHGRKVKGRCKQGAKHGKRCTLTLRKATLAFPGALGANRFTLLVRRLAPGRYMATLTALAAGKDSNSVTLSFTIKKPKKK